MERTTETASRVATSGIGVLDKAVAVLAAAAVQPCSLADLVERLALPRATAHRIATALETHRLLRRDPHNRWVVGPMVLELASAAGDPLADAAVAVLRRLRDQTGESAQVFVREGDVRVCVAAAERASGLRDTVPVGSRLSMAAGSAAHVLLAWSAPEDVAAVLTGAAYSPRTIAGVRRRGWSASIAERERGVASVSAPVRDRRGAVVAAISVSGPAERIGRSPGTRLSGPVVAAARDLGAHL